jgi:hypothetical protein
VIEIANKGLNRLNGVYSGVTRHNINKKQNLENVGNAMMINVVIKYLV